MSRPHDGQRTFFPFGNPFRTILPKGDYGSPRTRELLFSFEKNLAESLNKLKPEDGSEVLSLSWMKLAIEFLSKTHVCLKTLINELHLPVSDWDEKWIDVYLDNSVKLLDICIALCSELSRLDQGKLLLQYVLHLVDISTSSPTTEKITRAHAYLSEWIEQIKTKSPKLKSCPAIIETLQVSLGFAKGKTSKGKALVRALYGVKVMTIFICGAFSAMLSGSSESLVELQVSDEYFWSEAFTCLQSVVIVEIKKQFVMRKVAIFKEIEAVKLHALKLHDLTNNVGCEKEPEQNGNTSNHEEEAITTRKCSDLEREMVQDTASNLAIGVTKLSHELDSLSRQTNEFFQIILTGRDALLCNLRVPAV